MTASMEYVTKGRRKDEILFYKFLCLSYSVHAVIMVVLITTLGN